MAKVDTVIDNGKQHQSVKDENAKRKLSDSDIIYLMDVYEREWEHRDNILWKQTYRLFYFSLVLILLPSISASIQIELPLIHPKVFTCIGLLLALISTFISWSYGIRLEASSKTYVNLMRKLPPSYRRVKIDDLYRIKNKKMLLKNPFNKNSSIFTMVQTKLLATLFFVSEIIVALMILFLLKV